MCPYLAIGRSDDGNIVHKWPMNKHLRSFSALNNVNTCWFALIWSYMFPPVEVIHLKTSDSCFINHFALVFWHMEMKYAKRFIKWNAVINLVRVWLYCLPEIFEIFVSKLRAWTLNYRKSTVWTHLIISWFTFLPHFFRDMLIPRYLVHESAQSARFLFQAAIM